MSLLKATRIEIEGTDWMARERSIRKEIIALCGSMIVVLLGAVPLFDRHNDALILALFFGGFATGISFRNLIVKLRDRKGKEEGQAE
jgi:hypothetical protein